MMNPLGFNAAVSVASGVVAVAMLLVIVLVGLIARSPRRIRDGRRDRQAGLR